MIKKHKVPERPLTEIQKQNLAKGLDINGEAIGLHKAYSVKDGFRPKTLQKK